MDKNTPITTPFIRRTINIKRSVHLVDYFSYIYLAKHYYDAMVNDTDFPEKPLPSLQNLIDAHTITKAYIEAKESQVNLKLVKALLPIEQLTAVWLFYNEPELNMHLGKYQLLAVKHS